MREYRNGNEVDTSQLRWIGSSPPSLTKKFFKKLFKKVLTNRKVCGIIYMSRGREERTTSPQGYSCVK